MNPLTSPNFPFKTHDLGEYRSFWLLEMFSKHLRHIEDLPTNLVLDKNIISRLVVNDGRGALKWRGVDHGSIARLSLLDDGEGTTTLQNP